MLVKFTVFRSGYTGEDGVEIILPAKMASMAMKLLAGGMDKPDATIKPAGLGARDTLRLEAGMPLYGHELSETHRPALRRAGLGGGSEQGFHRRRAAARDRRRRPEAQAGRPGTGRPADRPAGNADHRRWASRRRSHQRHLRPDAAEEHRDGVMSTPTYAAEGTQLSADLKGTLEPGESGEAAVLQAKLTVDRDTGNPPVRI